MLCSVSATLGVYSVVLPSFGDYAALCCAMLRCVVLCYAVLGYATPPCASDVMLSCPALVSTLHN